MRPRTRPTILVCPRWLITASCLACLLVAAGCAARPTPPGGQSMSSSGGGLSFDFLRWKEGLAVLLVDDIDGGSHQSSGSGGSASAVYTAQGSASAANGRSYTWQMQTADGRTAKLTIQGKDYDLAKGALVLVRTKGGSVQVYQLDRDLSAIPYDPSGCRDHLQKDAEVLKFLETGEAPR